MFGTSVRLVTVLTIGLLATACATKPGDHFPEFEQKKQSIGTVGIMLDVSLVDDITGDLDKIDVKKNQELGKEILDSIWSETNLKGYSVKEGMLVSIGLSTIRPNSTETESGSTAADTATRYVFPEFRVANRDSDTNTIDDEKLPVATAPFYLDNRFSQNEEEKAALRSLYGTLLSIPKGTDQPSQKIDAAIKFGELLKVDTLFIASVRGRSVGTAKQLGMAIATGILSLGLTGGTFVFSTWSTSFGSEDLFLVNAKTGEVLWADNVFAKGGKGYIDRTLPITSRIMSRLPDRTTQVTKQQ